MTQRTFIAFIALAVVIIIIAIDCIFLSVRVANLEDQSVLNHTITLTPTPELLVATPTATLKPVSKTTIGVLKK